MSDKNKEEEPLILLCSGDHCDVACLPKIKDLLDGSEEKHERSISRLRAINKKFAAFGPNRLTNKMCNFEHSHSLGVPGKSSIKIYAIKADHFRLYGGMTKYNGRYTFVISEFDNNKKQNKANQSKLKSSAKLIGALVKRNICDV